MTDILIYARYVDFVNAFGSVDHSRMATLLEIQGYPRDIIIKIIKDLYTDADTIGLTPIGDTNTIPNLWHSTRGPPQSTTVHHIAIDPTKP